MLHLQFESYYNNNLNALTSFALKLTKNRMDADDLVQETAIKAYKNFHKFIQGASFKNWTFTILKNTFLTKLHKRKKTKEISMPIEDMEYALVSHPTIQSFEQKTNTMKQLLDCIESLSIKSREPFKMYIKGCSYNEISESLNIPIGTVKSRINYARKKLKPMITRKNLG